MSKCPDTDALTSVASALDWDSENGIRHLSSCADCQQQLRTLEQTHVAYAETGSVAATDIERILQKLSTAREEEEVRQRGGRTLTNLVEAALAGATALTIVQASGATAPATLTAIIFALTAGAVLGYRELPVDVAARLRGRANGF
jgi:transcriptional regulator NrdR family protein